MSGNAAADDLGVKEFADRVGEQRAEDERRGTDPTEFLKGAGDMLGRHMQELKDLVKKHFGGDQ
jgi:hypothetical protein